MNKKAQIARARTGTDRPQKGLAALFSERDFLKVVHILAAEAAAEIKELQKKERQSSQ